MANATILIVEDEVWLSKALKRRLSGEDYTVMVAGDGETGLAQAIAQHPSIILLDLRLPRLDGMELLKRLRAADEWGASVPVVILSNENSFAAIKEGVEQNAQAYLVKANTSLESIVATIKNLLSA